ncbi:MAG TPA: endolytic transglycosylase MltG [Candidatus Saccharimonadia bacterium]|nr:endolytic transglycosylase MltG [Candidatus Saccharimonadia bacterium]
MSLAGSPAPLASVRLNRIGRGRRRLRWSSGLIVLLALMVAGGYGWYRLELQPAALDGADQRFEVKAGQRAPDIATNLKAAGLIRDRNAFITYINFHGLRAHIEAGVYALSPTESTVTIANILAKGKIDAHSLVVPEGSRITDIEQLAAAQGITKADFEAALAAPHTQAFLSGKPANVSLEGYLFPDSYRLTANETAATLVDQMLATFGQKVGPEYAQAFTAEGLTLHQGLTLASIVEKEVNNAQDRPIVAQIFLKRLGQNTTLGSDVTARYAADLLGVAFSTNVDSPYNTRRFPGLPPGPICSPGLAALDAVAHPANTDYSYFLTGKDGKTYYAHTYAEHQANIAKYLN